MAIVNESFRNSYRHALGIQCARIPCFNNMSVHAFATKGGGRKCGMGRHNMCRPIDRAAVF
jgi:hypothetical protein